MAAAEITRAVRATSRAETDVPMMRGGRPDLDILSVEKRMAGIENLVLDTDKIRGENTGEPGLDI